VRRAIGVGTAHWFALELKREEAGAGSARFGLPSNLLPIREEDHSIIESKGRLLGSFSTGFYAKMEIGQVSQAIILP
jgi:hypothetical protein